MLPFQKTLQINLDEFIDYIIKCIEYYEMQSAPMHQLCSSVINTEQEEIVKLLTEIFNRKIRNENLDRIELVFERDK